MTPVDPQSDDLMGRRDRDGIALFDVVKEVRELLRNINKEVEAAKKNEYVEGHINLLGFKIPIIFKMPSSGKTPK